MNESEYKLSEGSQEIASKLVAPDPSKPTLNKRKVYTISFKLEKDGKELEEVYSGMLPELANGGHGEVKPSLYSLVNYYIGKLRESDTAELEPTFN